MERDTLVPLTLFRQNFASNSPLPHAIASGFEDDTDYRFRRGQTLVEKDVRFFLIEAQTRDVTISHEHSGFAWLPYGPALERVSFEDQDVVLVQRMGDAREHQVVGKDDVPVKFPIPVSVLPP